MRLWSIHPKYLDAKGLVALWRESLLAYNVLIGNTLSYINHPQLERFKKTLFPIKSINFYLKIIYKESLKRNYNFNKKKIKINFFYEKINITKGQIVYEKYHLEKKLLKRDIEKLLILKKEKNIEVHPIFNIINGKIEKWEKFY